MIIEKLEVGPFASNCYIVGHESDKEGMIIDPGAEADRILKRVKNLGIKVGTADYRFLIALTLVVGLVVVLVKGDVESGKVLSPLVLLAVAWYYKDKAKR